MRVFFYWYAPGGSWTHNLILHLALSRGGRANWAKVAYFPSTSPPPPPPTPPKKKVSKFSIVIMLSSKRLKISWLLAPPFIYKQILAPRREETSDSN